MSWLIVGIARQTFLVSGLAPLLPFSGLRPVVTARNAFAQKKSRLPLPAMEAKALETPQRTTMQMPAVVRFVDLTFRVRGSV